MTDWKEHDGGPQPVGDDVWVEYENPFDTDPFCGPAGAFEWGGEDCVKWRILNQPLIDAARLEGIRLGLEAAAKTADLKWYDPQDNRTTDTLAFLIRTLDPETIAREATLDTLTAEAQAQSMGYDQHDTKRHPAALIGHQEATND